MGTPKVYVDLYSFSRANVAKYHKLGGLNNRSIFCHSSGGWKSDIKVSAGLVCFESWEGESVPRLFLASGSLLSIFDIPLLVDVSP